MKRNIKQLRAIYYSTRERKQEAFNNFIETNKIDLKDLGLDRVKYLEVCCRKLRKLGFNIYL